MWLDEWRAIGGRIRSLVEAGAFFLRTNDTEMSNASNYLIENAHDTVRGSVHSIKHLETSFKRNSASVSFCS